MSTADGPANAQTIPFGFAKRHGIAVSSLSADVAEVVHRRGVALGALAEVRRFLGKRLHLRMIEGGDFDAMLTALYEHQSGPTADIVQAIGKGLDLESVVARLPEPEDLLDSDGDAPVIQLINALLAQAIREKASDIHLEPFEKRFAVRFRVDGSLREVLQPRPELAPILASRIKVMAKLDIAERRVPQDGRISLTLAGRSIDVRVSTIPSGPGERVVMRILDRHRGRLDLEALGMNPDIYAAVDDLISRPHGTVLVTGPTGSGKTTTLYGILERLNDRRRNILTVEDPIEYYIDGIGQTQVNPKINMDFARGLRAILRQDPDVVMVGEIRDLETARIAVHASLTGHIVLSTLHTNTAIGAVTRLKDMGIEQYLLAAALSGMLAQRLVRLLCNGCKLPGTGLQSVPRSIAVSENDLARLYRPIGCEACADTGYRGRTGVFELVTMDQTLRQMVHDGAAEQMLERHARESSPSLADDALQVLLAGRTSLEDVLRATRD